MIRSSIIAALGFAIPICSCISQSTWASAPASPLYDRSALIQQLHIKDPDHHPYATLDEWLKEAPTPPSGISRERRDAFYRAWVTLWINIQPAQGAWTKPIICPGDNYVRGIWEWDSAFHIFALAHGGPKARRLGLWQIQVMLSGQDQSGKIPREIWQDGPKFFGEYRLPVARASDFGGKPPDGGCSRPERAL